MTKMRAKNRLTDKLGSGGFALTLECLPPRGSDPAATRQLATCFPKAVDAIVVADNHHEVRSSALACAALLSAAQAEPILSLVTRDRNRIALESDVLGAAALGIRAFLCLTGVHQSIAASPKAAGVYDLDACQLSQALATMADAALDFSGNRLEHSPDLFVAATVHPSLRPIELSLLGLRKKIAAGAQAVFTDRISDIGTFETWLAAVRAVRLDQRVAIIASVKPEDLEIARRLRKMAGVSGIHLLSGGDEVNAGRFFEQAGLAEA
jgi:methylenetetrahydrofolate reductase (NADPH)